MFLIAVLVIDFDDLNVLVFVHSPSPFPLPVSFYSRFFAIEGLLNAPVLLVHSPSPPLSLYLPVAFVRSVRGAGLASMACTNVPVLICTFSFLCPSL